MDAQELRSFSVDELKGRIHHWQDELFRMRFKSQTTETKDTSLVKKLRKDIARGKTVLTEKLKGIVVSSKAEAPVSRKSVEETQPEDKAPRKTAAKKSTARKKAQDQ